jgi:hypothetical protein
MGSSETRMGVQVIHKDREVLWITEDVQLKHHISCVDPL